MKMKGQAEETSNTKGQHPFALKKICADLVGWHTEHGKLWQEDLEFKNSLSYKLSFKGTCNIRPYLKKKEKHPRQQHIVVICIKRIISH